MPAKRSHFSADNLLIGITAELLLGAIERQIGRADEKADSAAYLESPLQYGVGGDGAEVLLDQHQAVMMEWERPLMLAHAQVNPHTRSCQLSSDKLSALQPCHGSLKQKVLPLIEAQVQVHTASLFISSPPKP